MEFSSGISQTLKNNSAEILGRFLPGEDVGVVGLLESPLQLL